MEDFIFGTLATDESRLKHLRATLGGVTHAQKRIPLDPQPDQPVQLTLTLGPLHPHNQAWVYWTNDGSDPQGEHGIASNGHATAMHSAGSTWETILWGYVRTFRAEIPPQPAGTLVRYRIAAGGHGAETFADNGTYYAFYVDNDPPPDWTKQAIIYQIFADRFFNTSADFPHVEGKPSLKANGTLSGIIAKLDYLTELGINCLWLTPVFPSPSYHGYDATSFFEINPRLGTAEEFKELVEQAHQRGIRILMDFVPNHWSNEHPTFRQATTDQNSEYAKWYTFHEWPHQYKMFFTSKSLPQINLRYPPARQHVLDAAKYWLEFGVDGFRVDYCIGPTPDFYADFRRVTRATKPDSWTFGEAVDPPDSQLAFEGGMDGALDFMLHEALRLTFAYQRWNAIQFAEFLDRHEAYFPASFSRPSFLDNHDMNRFLWAAGGDLHKLKLAALCQFTLAGAPVIYYGTEVGLSQVNDVMQNNRAIHEEARLPMIWDEEQNNDLFEFYRQLIQIRKENPALAEASRETLFVSEHALVYRRGAVVCALNLSGQAQALTLTLAESRLGLGSEPGVQIQTEGGTTRVILPPYAGAIIQ